GHGTWQSWAPAHRLIRAGTLGPGGGIDTPGAPSIIRRRSCRQILQGARRPQRRPAERARGPHFRGGVVARPCKKRRALFALVALGAVAMSGARATAQDLVRFAHHVAGDSKPITLHADAVATWVEGGQRVVLLKGTVLIEHGVVHAR